MKSGFVGLLEFFARGGRVVQNGKEKGGMRGVFVCVKIEERVGFKLAVNIFCTSPHRTSRSLYARPVYIGSGPVAILSVKNQYSV